jgi:hypothetical protein
MLADLLAQLRHVFLGFGSVHRFSRYGPGKARQYAADVMKGRTGSPLHAAVFAIIAASNGGARAPTRADLAPGPTRRGLRALPRRVVITPRFEIPLSASMRNEL